MTLSRRDAATSVPHHDEQYLLKLTAGLLHPLRAQQWRDQPVAGQVAAHELTHAFDSAGRLYNQQGKLEQWWTNRTSEGFEKIQKCISDQYSEYTIDDGKGGKIHVNGNL